MSAMSSGTNTASASSRPESQTATWTKPRSSLTCVSSHSPVQPTSTGELRTWLARAFPASHTASQATRGGQTTNGICGLQQSPCFAQFDHGTHGWKTCLALFPSDTWPEFSGTWPRWGSMRSGAVYQRESKARPMCATGSGFVPTPTTHNAKECAAPSEYTRNTPTLAAVAGGKLNPEWTEWLMGWPTGWTDLEPLGTDRFQAWSRGHGG